MYLTFIAGIGGFFGTILRYLLNIFIYQIIDYPGFPYGTLIINLLGCLLIGVIAGFSESRITLTPELRIFFQIGMLGGFTTFSTFGYETFRLLQEGQLFFAILNISFQVVVGILAVWIGYQLCR